MSRLLAYMANDPQRIRCALYPGRALLVDPGTAAPLDGWGVGFYQGGEVLLQRRPKPPDGPMDFYDIVKDIRTDALIGHMRQGTVGVAKNENTHPFRFRSWLFAHHGTIAGFEEHKDAILEPVPDYLRRNIRGQTDSEHLFHLFLAGLHAAGKVDDPLISTRIAEKALTDAIAHCDRVTGIGASTYDVAVTNGRILIVTRRGLSLHYYRLDGVRDCPVCREAPADFGRGSRPGDHEHLRAVVIVGNGRTDRSNHEGGSLWQEVPEAHLIAVTHDLNVQIHPLSSQPKS